MNDTEGAAVGGRYRLDQPVGRGRAGFVHLAFDTMLHRTVAAKRLHVDGVDGADGSGGAADVLLTQAHQAMRVVHPNAVRVHDAVRDGTDVWLIMEYVPSRTMAEFLAEHGALTPSQAAHLGAALGSALQAAHAVGVPHGRVCPATVLLADDGGVKLTDVGIHDRPPDPAYRAPETAYHGTATPEADAYSLGATLFTAVEGVPPYGADGTDKQVLPSHGGPLTGALIKLLRAEPDLRPTLADTVEALRAVNAGRKEGFVPPTAPAMPTVPLVPRPPGTRPVHPGGTGTDDDAGLPTPPPRTGPGPSVRQPGVVVAWGLLVLVVVATVLLAASTL